MNCSYCGSEIKRLGRCPTCNYLMAGCLEDDREPLPLTDEQQAVEDTLVGWFEQWEQERHETESLRRFATRH